MKKLCVFIYKNPTDEVLGKTKRYLTELKPNVFAGTISSGVMDHLWKIVADAGIKASLVYSDDNEQGFSYRFSSDEMKNFLDFDGILLPFKENCGKISISSLYAKPSKKLLDHLLETGTVAEVLLRSGRGHSAVKQMADYFHVPEEEIIQTVAFLCAVHDIGKAHPGFQWNLSLESEGEVNDVANKLLEDGMILEADVNIRHERYSMEIIKDYLVSKGFSKEVSSVYASIIAFHHQGKDRGKNILDKVDKFCPQGERWSEWDKVQKELLSIIEQKWTISERILNDFFIDETGINGFTYFILSIMVTADWITSSANWTKYLLPGLSIKEAAEFFLSDNHLAHNPISRAFRDVKWDTVFSFPKNDLQKSIGEMISGYADLLLIEYPCGYGKTEAALLAALIMGLAKSGIYFAAPTMSTAKALAKRLQEYVSKTGLPYKIPEFDSSMLWSDEDMENSIDKELWVSKSRHQFLYPFAVGTIDQVLKTVIYSRYGCIGTLGLSDKVVVIDEVHAYDAYMLTELKNLILWCRFFKVPVILLSATLPTKTKKELFIKAAGCPSNVQIDSGYPLISMIKNRELTQISPLCIGKDVNVEVVKTKDTEEEMLRIAKEMEEGCIAFVTTTIDDAFQVWKRMKQEITGCEIILYHGRDTVFHKSEKIKKLLYLLGKDRSHRPRKLIVVATSIIEQSLDVDFDYMVTNLAPIDLLIQRMGRVHRHDDKGTIRERIIIEKPFTILIPEKFGTATRIYEENILRRTCDVLLSDGNSITGINTVSSVRGLIDKVYVEPGRKEGKSQMNAGEVILSDPYLDVIAALELKENNYRHFDPIIAKTREETYETVSIAMLRERKDSYTPEDMKHIMNECVVNVPKKKVDCFTPVQMDVKWLQNYLVFINPNLQIEENGQCMALTDDGLEIN